MRASRSFIWPLSLLHLCLTALATSYEQFDEDLVLTPLPDGKVSAAFTFTTLLHGAAPRDSHTLNSPDESQHYTLFPLALGQLLREHAVTELHLALNAGNWDYARWGAPTDPAVGTGGELWAWMGTGGPTSIDARWQGLRNSLAGLFCASLGALDAVRTTVPAAAFPPEGSLPFWPGTPVNATTTITTNGAHEIRHASLPAEHVCTENLTPFLKLLPCKSQSGLAALLNPHRLFGADWHGLGVHVRWVADAGVEVRLIFQGVFNPLRAPGARGKSDWSLNSLFDRAVSRSCPVALTSAIQVVLPSSGSYSITPEPPSVSGGVAVYDVHTSAKPLNVALSYPQTFNYPSSYASNSTPFSVQRTLTGTSQAWGRLSVRITNHQSEEMHVLYLETMPWLLQFYLHTLAARVDGVLDDTVISHLTYTPAIAHGRPTTLQALVRLPPHATVQLSMEVAKAFLRYTEHPPDAQRGWDLPPAVLVPVNVSAPLVQSGVRGASAFLPTGPRVYTNTLLVDLATPDFSMPYNVIIFTCTLVAGIFGTVFNTLTRRWIVVRIKA